MSVAPVDSPEFAVKLSDPFPFPFLNIECVFCVDFFQDGNRKVSDVVTALAEVLASGLAGVTILNIPDMFFHSSSKFPFCFAHILHIASSLETGYNIDHPGGTAVNRSIDVHSYSSN